MYAIVHNILFTKQTYTNHSKSTLDKRANNVTPIITTIQS